MQKLKSKLINICFLAGLIMMVACGKDDEPKPIFGIAFETTALGIDKGTSDVEVKLTFTIPTTQENTAVIDLTENGVSYGDDYATVPALSNGQLTLTIPKDVTEASFVVKRVASVLEAGNAVTFELTSITGESEPQISGNTSVKVSFEAIASAGSTMFPNIGGPTEPNLVFVDLSLNSQMDAERASWDLGFYSGSDDEVVVNFSTYGMARALEATDLNAISASDTVGFSSTLRIGTAGANIYVDNPNGDLAETAITSISSNDNDNKVYIINRGHGPGNSAVDPGSVRVDEIALGWKKIRILKRGSDYLLQYADINASTFSEITISKNENYNLTYFSFESESVVDVEPQAAKWDLVFTVSSNVINFGAGLGAYGFSDYVKTNRLGGVDVAMVELERDDDGQIIAGQTTYDGFSQEDISNVSLSAEANVIGSGWRSVFSRTANDYRFYIIKDSEGNYYKIQFLGLLDQMGIRGNSSFKYELL